MIVYIIIFICFVLIIMLTKLSLSKHECYSQKEYTKLDGYNETKYTDYTGPTGYTGYTGPTGYTGVTSNIRYTMIDDIFSKNKEIVNEDIIEDITSLIDTNITKSIVLPVKITSDNCPTTLIAYKSCKPLDANIFNNMFATLN